MEADPTTREGWFFTRPSTASCVPGAAQHEPLLPHAEERALSAFTRVFHALWRGVSKHEGRTAAPSFETRARSFEFAEPLRQPRSSG